MARFHYYQFPNDMDAHTRYMNGAMNLNGECTLGQTCQGCTICTNGWQQCKQWRCLESEEVISGITISEAKRLLKKFGGAAWTDHCDRDGGVFETTEIKLTGNNSCFKYNRHL